MYTRETDFEENFNIMTAWNTEMNVLHPASYTLCTHKYKQLNKEIGMKYTNKRLTYSFLCFMHTQKEAVKQANLYKSRKPNFTSCFDQFF